MGSSNKVIGSRGDGLYPFQIVDQLISGCPAISLVVNGDIELDFANVGDISYLLLVKDKATLTINPGMSGQFQKMHLVIKNAALNTMVSFSDTINFGDNKPYISSKKDAVTIIELSFDGYNSIYGRQVFNG